MATIIRFPAEAAAWRAQTRARERGHGDGQFHSSGEILIFTGVRYERHEDDLGHRSGTTPGKRKRRAKA
jgi:hypothetical protein